MDRRLDLEISMLLGEPINIQHNVPVAIEEVADTYTAEAGEHVWRIRDLDKTADVCYTIGSNGVITPVKRTPKTDVLVTFSNLNTPMDYVLVTEVLNSVDTNALAERKAAITRAMDKLELKTLLDGILTPTNTLFPYNEVGGYEVTVESGDDLYDVFLKGVHGVEDWGDNYSAMVGKTVKEKIDTYAKDYASTHNYDVNLTGKLAQLGITVRKIFGKVAPASEVEVDLLNAKKFVMVAKDSTMSKGKPIQFVRRKINATIAAQMGVEVDNAQRGILVTDLVYGYGVHGFESYVMAVKYPKGIAIADLSEII